MRSVIHFIFLCLLANLTGFSQGILGIDGEEHSLIGIYIKDLKADTIMLDYNASFALTPASIMKVYTTASAMSLLDENFRFETKVFMTGNKNKLGHLNGDIVIKASGDPTLESEFFSKNQGFIAQIIDALKSQGISRINGDIILARVDENRQYPEGPIDTWEIDDVPWSYGAGIFDFNWCDNYIGLYPATGKTTSPYNIKYSVWTRPWKDKLNLFRGIYSDTLIISGKSYATDRKARVNTSMPYPFDIFRAKIIERLENSGIKITCQTSSATQRTLLVTHRSPALDEILRSLMVRSDNTFAEGLLRTLGPRYGDLEESVKTENSLWSSRGFRTEFTHIVDGSGLSRANAFSPIFLGGVLEYMSHSSMKERFIKLFPLAGRDGTVKNFMADTPLNGRLALKSGSMNGVQCYAGYVLDLTGEPTHIVVMMMNNFWCKRAALRTAIKDLLLTYIY